jgi:hypothetical protein
VNWLLTGSRSIPWFLVGCYTLRLYQEDCHTLARSRIKYNDHWNPEPKRIFSPNPRLLDFLHGRNEWIYRSNALRYERTTYAYGYGHYFLLRILWTFNNN